MNRIRYIFIALFLLSQSVYSQHVFIGGNAGINFGIGGNYSGFVSIKPSERIDVKLIYAGFYSTNHGTNILAANFLTEIDYHLQLTYSFFKQSSKSIYVGIGGGISEVRSSGSVGHGRAYVKNIKAEPGFSISLVTGKKFPIFKYSALVLELFARYSSFGGSRELRDFSLGDLYTKESGTFNNFLIGFSFGILLDITPPQLSR